MPVEINVTYEGDLRCRAVHGPSGSELVTAPPADNQGNGERFAPTDLVATSLASCLLTMMGIAARKRKIDITGATARVEKSMVNDPRRRIGALGIVITVPGGLGEKERTILERSAHACPVHRSLDPRVEVDVDFVWE